MVDDLAPNLQLLEAFLSHAGFCQLHPCTDPFEAERTAAEFSPDLAILDLHVPGLDGDELLLRLRDQPSLASLPAIILTADSSPEARRRAVLAGAQCLVHKPFRAADLLRCVRDLLAPISAGLDSAHWLPAARGPRSCETAS